MYKYSNKSKNNLSQCHPDLQLLFNEVICFIDCTVMCGHRSEEDQNKVYNSGNSKVKFPNSKHNSNPSMAVDVAPYPIDWDDTGRFYVFAGYVLLMADLLDIKIRWGGDWDSDFSTTDQRFNDLAHFELVL